MRGKKSLLGYTDMGMGILICGLNGCGKSTLGKALADRIGFHFIDNENLFFERTELSISYTNPRSHREAEEIFAKEIIEHPNFIFAAVTGNYGKDILSLYQYVILVETPKNIRIQRIRERSYQKFGKRMLPGGDLYQQEEAFFRFAEERPGYHVESWITKANIKCPVIRVDGTGNIDDNIEYIIKSLNL